MKKMILMAVAAMMAMSVNAQVTVDMSQCFEVPEKATDLNDAATVKDGVVFVGDTRPAEKIQDGKYKGMRIQKQGRYYSVGGKAVKFASSLSFRRAPQGATKDHVVDVNMVPRSCMLQLKPTSNGQFSFCAITSKDQNNLYVAVVNGTTFRPLATVAYTKGEENYGRKKDSPAEVKTVDYQYTEGDEVWIYSDGGISLHTFTFSGQTDKAFTGTDPVAAAKKISKANKK